jgi:asparaginyl-tRNA synthetase
LKQSNRQQTLDEVLLAIASPRAGGKTVVLANGVFDLFHVGHLRYLEAAKAEGDILVVAVNSDASTRLYKGPARPLVPESERAEIVSALACVDHVFLFDDADVRSILERLRPEVHAKGTDYTPESVPERAVVAAYGGKVAICGDPKDHSTTSLFERVAETAPFLRSSAPMSELSKRPTITEIQKSLDAYEGKEVELRGWLYHKRSSGKIHFLQLRDGTATLQCVMGKKDVDEDTFKRADHLPQESSIRVRGVVRKDTRSPLGFELGATGLDVLQLAESYPISPKEHGVAFLMDHRHLWLRSSRQHKIIRIRHTIIKAIRDFFDSRDFVLVDAPIFTPNACEGTTNLFEVGYFEDSAYLTQSGQLYMEAGAMAHGKVYCFGPTFRAEKSKTRRHLTEFWMVEPEVAYMDLNGDMDLAEDMVSFIVERVLEKHEKDLEAIGRNVEALKAVKKPFPRISHKEAVDRINSAIQSGTADPRPAGTERAAHAEGTEEAEAAEAKHAPRPAKHDDDFGAEDETILSRMFDRPVMVHRYPYQVKAFYMKRDPEDAMRALCVDVLAPEGYGEIIGGGQREDDLETLLSRIDEHHLPREAFKWFTDLRRYGTVPHAGFGLGIERTVAWICGLHHVRETIPFPRMMERLSP